MEESQKKLHVLRETVRDIDRQILTLAAQRQRVAQEIGQIKLEAGLPIKDFAVEKTVLENSRKIARELGLYQELGADLIACLIKYSVISQDEYHRRQQTIKAGDQKKILIIGGLGRMGQWQAEFFAAFGHSVTLHDAKIADGAALKPVFPIVGDQDLQKAVMAADVVVIATPIEIAAAVIDRLAAWQPSALIFDICSLKTPVEDALRRAANRGCEISSVHPMFGPQVDTLAGRNILICHVASERATKLTTALFKGTTAQLVRLDIAKHDQLMSYVLGLSHLINMVFARVLTNSSLTFKELRQVASTTFNAQLQVTTPVIQENQELYYSIQTANGFTPKLIQALEAALKNYQDAVANRDFKRFAALMQDSRAYWEQT